MDAPSEMSYAEKIEALVAERAYAAAALAQQPAQPVAWISPDYFTAFSRQGFTVATHKIAPGLVPLYAAPQQAAPAPADLYDGLTLNQVKANLALLKEDDLRGLVVSLLITQRIAEKYAAPAQPSYEEYAMGIEDGFDIGQRAAARQPLTDEQIAQICIECAQVTPSDVYFARAIEAAHGIKATGEGAA